MIGARVARVGLLAVAATAAACVLRAPAAPAGSPSGEPAVARFLARQPEFRVLTVAEIEPDGSALVAAARFKPVVVADPRRSGSSSTFAVVVRGDAGGRQFALVELRGARPDPPRRAVG